MKKKTTKPSKIYAHHIETSLRRENLHTGNFSIVTKRLLYKSLFQSKCFHICMRLQIMFYLLRLKKMRITFDLYLICDYNIQRHAI